MENSTNPDTKKNNCPEESSSWTFYIQGFMYDQNDDDETCMSSDDHQLEESPSLLSDAASAVVKLNSNIYNSNSIRRLSPIDDEMNLDECRRNNLGFCPGKSHDHDHHHHPLIPRRTMCLQNSLSCKKHKNKLVTTPSLENYDLEDTASSPVNSPKKVVCINQFMAHKQKGKKDDHHHHHHHPEVKRNIFGKGEELGGEKNTTNYINLKKRTCG